MPPFHNGRKIKKRKSTNNVTKKKLVGRDSAHSLAGSKFEGFKKLPAVALQRIDLSPYIVSSKTKNVPENGSKVDLNQKATQQCLIQKCSVQLVNSNLDKLKEDFLRLQSESPFRDPSETMQRLKSGSVACKICEKVYSNEKKLQNHQENKHMIIYKPKNPNKALKRVTFSDKVIVHELKEYHKCRKCPKIFEEYKTLKRHMKLRHKKRKCYICNYCSKKFVDRMFFKVHIKLHCDVCTLLLPNKKSFIEHRRSVCRVLKLLKCKECDDTYFRFMDLKDHSYSHTDILLVCDVCKDQFRSKCALAHHLAFLHSKQRPKSLYTMRNLGSERLYLCDFCEESSVEKDFIEKHLEILPDLSNRAMTGYKDYYFCDQCFKKFDTETEMLTHKWSHFLKTDQQNDKNKGIFLNSQLKNNHFKEMKLKYKLDEELPAHFKPTIRLERLNLTEDNNENSIKNSNNENSNSNGLSHALIESVPKPIQLEQEKSVQNYNEDSSSSNVTENSNSIKSNENSSSILQDLLKRPIERDVNLVQINGQNSCFNSTNSNENSNSVKLLGDLLIDGEIKKPVVDPKSKKKIIYKHQCPNCGKYYSRKYTLNRHIEVKHSDFENLQCKVCEETFVWPSLLRSHKCIRIHRPELPFDDARPEIHFDNLDIIQPHFDDLPIEDDYIQAVDFEIPTPIVESKNNETSVKQCMIINNGTSIDVSKTVQLPDVGYRLLIQEVPIEF